MIHLRLVQFFVIVLMISTLHHSDLLAQDSNSHFALLSDEQNGIVFFKDECKKNAFSLIFSFSQDLKDASYQGLALVDFSKNFKEDLKSSHDGIVYAYLEVQSSQKIGNRQIRIDYIAKKVSDDGGLDTDLDISEQIEILLLDEDFKRIFNVSGQSLEVMDISKKTRTLVNSNLETSCLQTFKGN